MSVNYTKSGEHKQIKKRNKTSNIEFMTANAIDTEI